MVQAEDLIDLLGAVQHRAKGIGRVGGSDTVAAVDVFDKAGQPGVGAFQIGDALQTEFFDQSVLEGLIGSFDPALGLGSARMDRLDIEGLQGAGELGDFPIVIGMMDPKDAVAIRIERDRAAMLCRTSRRVSI